MEVNLDKRYPIHASAEQAWAVLSDIRATAACMPGATITEQVDETHYKGTVKSKVGPATMQFGGDIEVLGVDAASQSMQMLGKGSDKGGSSASMNLTARIEPGAEPGQCTLVGQAAIIVSGKLAQFGSRLLVPISDALLAQFAQNFSAAAAAVAVPSVQEAGAAAGVPGSEAASAPSPASAEAAAAPMAVQSGSELNAFGLMWSVVKAWFAGLFSSGSKSADRPGGV